jgi:D-amino peptidase
VPVVLVSGDQAAIAEVRELVPDIEGVQVKEAIGTAAARSLRPEEAVRLIREGVARAIRRRGEIEPVPAGLPARFEVSFTDPSLALMAEQIPTVERTGPHTIAFVADDYLAGYRFVRVLYKFIQ